MVGGERAGSPRRRWLWHLLVCAVVVTGGVWFAHVHVGAQLGTVVALSVAAALLLLFRYRLALPVLVGEVVLLAVSIPTHLLSPGVGLATAVAVYTFSLQVSRRTGAAVTIGLAAAMLVAVVLADPEGHSDDPPGGDQYVLVVLLAGTLGDAIRTQRAHLAALTERAERAERTREALARQRVAEDRLSVARDLHDVVAHQIAVINLHAGVASSALRTRPDTAESSLAVVRGAARTVLSEIGDLMATLRDPDAVDTAPVGLSQLDEVVRSFATLGLAVTVRTDGQRVELPGTVDVTALRVVQEALTNVHKHGSEPRAELLLTYLPGTLRVSVTNPVDHPAAVTTSTDVAVGTGQGLLGMAERVASVRGTLAHGPSSSGTWTLVVDLPLTARADQFTPDEERP